MSDAVYVAHPWDVMASQIAAGAQTAEQAAGKWVTEMREQVTDLEDSLDSLESDASDLRDQIEDIWAELAKHGIKRRAA